MKMPELVLPEEIWLIIAENSHARDILELSKSLKHQIAAPAFHTRLEWTSKRAAGLYTSGYEYILNLFINGSSPAFVKFVLRALDERQKRFLLIRMAGLENKWKYVEFLVKECNFPVAYLEIILPYLRLYKLQDNVEQISRIIDSQTEGRIVANTESNTAEKCYEKIRNRMIKWLEERKENQVEIIDNSHALHKIKSHIKGGAMRPSFFRDGHILAWDCMCLAMENNDIELVEFILRLGYFRSLSLDAPLPIEYVKLIFDYGVLVYFTTCNTVDPQLVKSVKLAFKYHGGCQSSIFRLKFLYANQDVEGLLEFLLNYQSENWSLGNATALITLHLKNYSLFEPETAFDIMERILKIVSLSSGIVFPIDVLRTIWLLSYETGSGVILSGMFKKYFAFLKK